MQLRHIHLALQILRTWDEVMHDLQISRTRCDFLIPTMVPGWIVFSLRTFGLCRDHKNFSGHVADTMEELAGATSPGQASDAIHASFNESDLAEFWPPTRFSGQ